MEKLADQEARMNEENTQKLAGTVVTYGYASRARAPRARPRSSIR